MRRNATDNGGPFRVIELPVVHHHPPRAAARAHEGPRPRQNGSRERGFGTLKYERLFLHDIPDGIELIERATSYRIEYNNARPPEAITWNRRVNRAPRQSHPNFHRHVGSRCASSA
ncbi:hypothetical protein GCM10027416_18990 [Okibacterium endophyticum]